MVGCTESVGAPVGAPVGNATVGELVGCAASVGAAVGNTSVVGAPVGCTESVGELVGCVASVGEFDGAPVGATVGVGEPVGATVGDTLVGEALGRFVGWRGACVGFSVHGGIPGQETPIGAHRTGSPWQLEVIPKV